MNLFKAHVNGENIQSCKEHCFNTAKYAKQSVEGIGIDDTAYLCGLLHDAGKYTDEFNKYIEASARGDNVAKGSVIHSFAGLRMVLSNYHSHYNKDSLGGLSDLSAELVAIAIGSHHGLFDVYGSDGKSGFDYRFEKQPDYDKRAEKNVRYLTV